MPKLRICQISDTHLGITSKNAINYMLEQMTKEEFDVLVHCGDWCGTLNAWQTVRDTLKLIRARFPDKQVLATLGNHDYWTHPATLHSFTVNLRHIERIFKRNKVHFLDRAGVWKSNGVVIIGASGWYAHPRPPTNDINYLPSHLEGHTHGYLLNLTELALKSNEYQGLLKKFDKEKDTLVFVSHFPVIKAGMDYKGRFEDFSWSESIGKYYKEVYNCRYFLNGHAHMLHKGPLRYESGSDYYVPAYQIIEID